MNRHGQLLADGSIENVILQAPEPFHLPPVYVAGALVGEPSERGPHALEIVVAHADGELLRFTGLRNFTLGRIGKGALEKVASNFGTIVPSLQFPGPGIYEFRVVLDGVVLGAAMLYAVVGDDSRPAREQLPTGIRTEEEEPSARDILRRTREILENAKAEAARLEKEADPGTKLAALNNVVVWGRAVTNVLQNLRSALPEGVFDAWYDAWRREMEADPLLKYLYRLRTQMLKEGQRPPLSVRVERENFNPARDLPPPPPNALGFFVGDEAGGSGWLVRLPDGSLGKMYMRLPEGTARTLLDIADLPSHHLGMPVRDRSINHVAKLFLHYLERIVYTAEQEFAGRERPGEPL